MDWLKQTQDTFKKMMDTQQQLLENWSSTVKDMTGLDTASLWKKSIQTWENSFNNFIETQGLFSRMWARNIASESETPGTKEYVKAVESVSETWISTQKKMWEGWFDMLREFDPAQMTDASREQAASAMNAWQENMQKMVAAQTEWAEQWMDTFKTRADKK